MQQKKKKGSCHICMASYAQRWKYAKYPKYSTIRGNESSGTEIIAKWLIMCFLDRQSSKRSWGRPKTFCLIQGRCVTKAETDRSQSQINYILTSREQKRLIRDCKVIAGKTDVAQHQMAVADMRLARKKMRQTRRKRKIQGGRIRIQGPSVREGESGAEVLNC